MVSPLHCGPLALTGAPPARLTFSRLTMCEWVGWLDCPIRAPQCKNTTLHCTTPGMHFWLVGHHLSFGPGVSEWVGWNASGFQPRSGRLVPPHTPHTIHFSNMTPKCTIHFVLFSLNLDVLTDLTFFINLSPQWKEFCFSPDFPSKSVTLPPM